MTVNEVKELLKIYYDIPQMIDEEFATIRHCEEQKDRINLPSVNLSGLPGGKGVPGDRTANMALADQARYYEDEIMNCYRRIAALREKKNWLGLALGRLDKTDRYILELAYMGSPDPKQRHRTFRRPPWKEIADKVEYSESQTRERVRIAMLQLMMLADQTAFPGMVR
ncbi:MAG: hypothetical protein ACLUDH_14060 [Faecalispora sporosphaeroides]|uniref:hypothetical protein n=1 Tax=Faecalispora sporosphaeroides TaxID=1549 RepID=UPI003993C81A